MADGAEEHTAALWRAYRLARSVQAAAPGTSEALGEAEETARARGWADVERALVFCRAIERWFRGEGDVLAAVETLIERSRAEGDHVLLALGLALRSNPAFCGSGHAGVVGENADLARAVVLLEQPGGHLLGRIAAHTACGIAFATRWLFELCDEQYAAALALGAGARGALDFALAPVLFNRAETQVFWASLLRQLGDHAGVAERRRAWQELAAEAEEPVAAVGPWGRELHSLGLLLAAIAGEDVGDDATGELAALGEDTSRTALVLALAEAVSDENAGRSAEQSVGRARRLLGKASDPFVELLVAYLGARVEAPGADGAGLAYAHRVLGLHWEARSAALEAMRARLETERLATEREELSRHARLDDLTGVGNRRALAQYLEQVGARGVAAIGLVLIDVDAFKEVNDRHGHLAGDAVLQRVAQLLERSVRPTDLVVRLGGDEFAVVLADADAPAALACAERVLEQLAEERFADVAPGLSVALSVGAAAGAAGDVRALFAAADAALYRAKAGGGTAVGAGVVACATA